MRYLRRSNGPSLWLIMLGSIGATAVSLLLVLSFLTKRTQFFVTAGLSDPSSNWASSLLGTIISVIASFSFVFATVYYYREVLGQVSAYDHAFREWDRVRAQAEVVAHSPEAEQLLRALSTIPSDTRIGKVVASWSDASPNSDAEAIIEGEAENYRSFLNFLSALASVMVLIGLVGNFFGLAEAAKNLPKLSEVPTSVASPAGNAPSPSRISNGKAQGQLGEDGPGNAASGDPKLLAERIQMITDSLQVVVTSSVMGIGGMVCLVIFVAFYRWEFNHLVSQEVLLMSVEIGAAVRPSHGRDPSSALQSLSESVTEMTRTLAPLPSKMENFDKVAGQLAAAQMEMRSVVTQLDSVLRQQVTQANASYQEYKDALIHFQTYLTDRTESLTSVFKVSDGVGQRLGDMVLRMQKIQESFETLVQSHKKNQLEYDNYAQLVRSLQQEDRVEQGRRLRELADEISETIKSQLSDSALELRKGAKDSHASLSELSRSISQQLEKLVNQSQTSQQTQESAQAALLESMRKMHQELSSQQAESQLLLREGMNRTLSESTALLNSARSDFEAHTRAFKSVSSDWTERQSLQMEVAKQSLEGLRQTLNASGEAIRQQTLEVQKATAEEWSQHLRAASESLVDATAQSKGLWQDQIETNQAFQRQISEALEKSLAAIEEAQRRQDESSDRWRTAHDLSLQALISSWTEQLSHHPLLRSANVSVTEQPGHAASALSELDRERWEKVEGALRELTSATSELRQQFAQGVVLNSPQPAEATVSPRSSVDSSALISEAIQSALSGLPQKLLDSQRELSLTFDSSLERLSQRLLDFEDRLQLPRYQNQDFKGLEFALERLVEKLDSRPATPSHFAEGEASGLSDLPDLLKSIREQASQSLEVLSTQLQWAEQLRTVLDTATKTLEGSHHRLVEREAGWLKSQETGAQELFQRWTEEFTNASFRLPEFKESLARLDDALARVSNFNIKELLVCPSCGVPVPTADGYCSNCSGSLVQACPQQVYLSRIWTNSQQQLVERFVEIAASIKNFEENIQRFLQTADESLNKEVIVQAPQPVVNIDLAKVVEPLTMLRSEFQSLRHEIRELQERPSLSIPEPPNPLAADLAERAPDLLSQESTPQPLIEIETTDAPIVQPPDSSDSDPPPTQPQTSQTRSIFRRLGKKLFGGED